jgi:hypothetical protein
LRLSLFSVSVAADAVQEGNTDMGKRTRNREIGFNGFDSMMPNGKKLGDCTIDELMQMGRFLITLATELMVKQCEEALDDPTLADETRNELRRALDAVKSTDDVDAQLEVLRHYGLIGSGAHRVETAG